MSSYSVYALIDPLTDEVRYIGSSCNAKRRYIKHISDHDKSNLNKQAWIDGLKNQGMRPSLVILEDMLEKAQCLIRERHLIQLYVRKGANLTNMRETELMPDELWLG